MPLGEKRYPDSVKVKDRSLRHDKSSLDQFKTEPSAQVYVGSD